MTPTRIFDILHELAPEKARDVISYKRLDKNSIVIRMMSGRSFIFRTDPKGEHFEFIERENVK